MTENKWWCCCCLDFRLRPERRNLQTSCENDDQNKLDIKIMGFFCVKLPSTDRIASHPISRLQLQPFRLHWLNRLDWHMNGLTHWLKKERKNWLTDDELTDWLTDWWLGMEKWRLWTLCHVDQSMSCWMEWYETLNTTHWTYVLMESMIRDFFAYICIFYSLGTKSSFIKINRKL